MRSIRRLSLGLGILAAFVASGAVQAAAPVDRARLIGAQLDLRSFPNSTGPRRSPEKRTPADYGFTVAGLEDDWVLMSAADDGWRLGLKLLDAHDKAIVVCFRDQARNGGSYDVQRVLVLTQNAEGLYAAVPGQDRADCPARP